MFIHANVQTENVHAYTYLAIDTLLDTNFCVNVYFSQWFLQYHLLMYNNGKVIYISEVVTLSFLECKVSFYFHSHNPLICLYETIM